MSGIISFSSVVNKLLFHLNSQAVHMDLVSAGSTIDLSNTIFLVQQQAGKSLYYSTVLASDMCVYSLLEVLIYCITEEEETNIKRSGSGVPKYSNLLHPSGGLKAISIDNTISSM